MRTVPACRAGRSRPVWSVQACNTVDSVVFELEARILSRVETRLLDHRRVTGGPRVAATLMAASVLALAALLVTAPTSVAEVGQPYPGNELENGSDGAGVRPHASVFARFAGLIDVSERSKARVLRDLGFDRDARCYFVKRTASSAKWVAAGFTDYATGRYEKCRPFDAWIIAVNERGKFNRVVTDNLRNSCRTFELDLFRAGASMGVVRDLRAAKGC